ncbi:MAG: type II toxin-antitoxin system HipA family toxin [Gammaproteobacteria bacterium]|nr:type II toxin-antitoxin system HipA family toxin [Gammaproteobacteria bacterium]
MVKRVDTAKVTLWGDLVGAVSWLDDRGYGVFEYDRAFLKKGLDISPLHMSLDDARKGDGIFSFPSLNKNTFLGLPGLLADALPDKFGNSIIDAWLARQSRDGAGFSPVERLCYMGKRGMGALEFSPAIIAKYDKSVPIEITELIELAQEIMSERKALSGNLGRSEQDNADAVMDILRVGTSAGGARPKAVIAMDDKGNVLSGQAPAPEGYDYWILKFDGVTDLELGEPSGYGRIEYAYYLMAQAAGIDMTECRLLEESGRAHFMTKRFDRVDGEKLHMQSLCGIAHYDFNMAGAYSYEQAFAVMRRLRLSKAEAVQQYRRIVFSIIARDLDDHTKNISFLMTADGKWKLSPAYDVIYSHNPAGKWTNQHQMTLNGKRDHFTKEDLIAVGDSISLSKPDEVIHDVVSAVERWQEFAKTAGINDKTIKEISHNHRLMLD